MSTTSSLPSKIFYHAKRNTHILMWLILLMTLAVRYAEPIRDGDLFFHIKYGEYMLENRTLIPDHSIYSWTPAEKDRVYCTWIGDILFYLMDRTGGLPLMFAFRYLCLLGLIIIIWRFSRNMGLGREPLTFLILATVILTSYSAAYLDPDIISALFFALTSWILFSVKASLWKKWGTRPFLLFPLIFLLWVNIHGVFFFGLVFLGLITLGEILNYRLRPQNALSAQGMRHLLTGSILSLASTFLTPYGLALHSKYIDSLNKLFAGVTDPGIKIVNAYQFTFLRNFSLLHYFDYWLIMTFSFLVLFFFLVWKKHEWDWAIFLPTVFLSLIFVRYIRATFYWPAFWAMSLIYLQKRGDTTWREVLAKARGVFISGFKFGTLVLFLFLSFRAMHNAYFNPLTKQWCGFGIGYQNPVQASAFLKKYRPGNLLYNSYDVGGYLMYDLYPQYKVFFDPRYFPYKEWFEEYYKFNNGKSTLKEFNKKYPFDVSIVDYMTSKMAITKFILSREWKPVFYGPSAAVFVKKDIDFNMDIKSLDIHRFDNIRNLYQAFQVFLVALNLEDTETADYIYNLIKNDFSNQAYQYAQIIRTCQYYQAGLKAFAEKDYDEALRNLAPLGFRSFSGLTNIKLTQLLNWKAKQYVHNREYKKALSLIEWILNADPNYVNGLYNAGMLSFGVKTAEKGNKEGEPNNKTIKRKLYLERFLELAPDHKQAPSARQALKSKRPPAKVKLLL